MGRIAAELVSEQIWEERCCHGFDGIGHAIAGEHTFQCYGSERINLLGTEKITKTWKGGNSHVKYEKNRTNSPL